MRKQNRNVRDKAKAKPKAKPRAKPKATAPAEDEALTAKRKLFVFYYAGAARFNGAEAARRAGYAPETARQEASRLLTNADIRAEIEKQLQTFAGDHGNLRREIMQEYMKLGFSNIGSVAEFNSLIVKARDGEELPPEIMAAIKSVKSTENGVTIELHDKKGALDSMAKALGMFAENPAQPGEQYESMIERLEREERERKANGQKPSKTGA